MQIKPNASSESLAFANAIIIYVKSRQKRIAVNSPCRPNAIFLLRVARANSVLGRWPIYPLSNSRCAILLGRIARHTSCCAAREPRPRREPRERKQKKKKKKTDRLARHENETLASVRHCVGVGVDGRPTKCASECGMISQCETIAIRIDRGKFARAKRSTERHNKIAFTDISCSALLSVHGNFSKCLVE